MDQNNIKDKYNLEYLERQIENLSKLIEINRIINATLDISKLLNIIMETIKDIMEADASSLLLYEESTQDLVFKVALGEAGEELTERYRVKIGQGIAGWVAANRKPVLINDVYSDERFDPMFDHDTGFKTKAILCVPLLFKGKLLGVIQAINPLYKSGFDEHDMDLFCAFANQAVLAVQNAIFFQNALEEERIKRELSSAQSFQHSLLPDISDKHQNILIAAKSIPAREVGGEFYDIFHLHNNSIGIALCDIHKKGIPGALYASIISGAIKALARVTGENPYVLLKQLNLVVQQNLQTINNVSLFYGLLTCEDKNLKFVNAGIAYPILVRKGVARYLKFSSKSLGSHNNLPKKINVRLKPGDFFVTITDGIINLKNHGSQSLGLKRIMDFLSNSFDTPEELIDKLIDFTENFTEGLERREDLSIIALKIE